MKCLILLTIFCGFLADGALAQNGKLVLKENTPTVAAAPVIPKSIPAEEWSRLESAMLRENWNSAALLSKQFLNSLDLETHDRQMARLRYIYLYSLAGKIIGHSLVGEKTDEESTRIELENVVDGFIGKEFLFPVRTILANCKGAVNYVCESTENPGFVRIAATNSDGNAIHSFEYIDVRSILDTTKHNKKAVVLGGFLKAVKFNSGDAFKGVMVLQFENGFVRNIFEK